MIFRKILKGLCITGKPGAQIQISSYVKKAQPAFSSRIEGFCLQPLKTPQDMGAGKGYRFNDQKLGKLVGNVVIAAIHAAERSLYTEISTEIGESTVRQ